MFIDNIWLRRSGFLVAILCISTVLGSATSAAGPDEQTSVRRDPVIIKLKPERNTGRGYQLVYLIDAPLDVVWQFKTDFDNQFLLSNRYFTSHRVLSQHRNEVVTENEYSNKPGLKFRWRTTLSPGQHLLEFVLLNPEECGQKYHYGHIQLEAVGARTRVTQVAYFDFFGVSFWVNYPFPGGMSSFLKYTAAWEQQTVLDLREKYAQ